jgi:hypothetical protein
MVIERLGSPEKFVRVSEAVMTPPDPPACWGIPAESPRAPACVPTRFQQCTLVLSPKTYGFTR